MGFFSELKKSVSALTDTLTTELKKYHNRDVLDGAMAACALIAAADGVVSVEERRKMTAFVKTSPMVSVFGTEAALKEFTSYVDRIEVDYDMGRAEALRVIGKLRARPEEAKLVVRTAIIVGKADGDFDSDEKNAVRDIIKELGIDPTEFDFEEESRPRIKIGANKAR